MKIIEKNGIRYIIKPEDGVVVGLLKTTWQDLWENVESQLSWKDSGAIECLFDDYGPVIIKGIARCAEGDEFDEAYGMKLAEARGYRKMHDMALRSMAGTMRKLNKIYSVVVASALKHQQKVDKIDEDLKEYFGIEDRER